MQGEAQATLSCAFFRPHLQAARSLRDKSVVETRALATVSCGFVFTAFHSFSKACRNAGSPFATPGATRCFYNRNDLSTSILPRARAHAPGLLL